MSAQLDAFQMTLQALRAQYVANLPHKLAQLRAAWSCVAADNANVGARSEVNRFAHMMVGNGNTFGCPEISALAREVCDLCAGAHDRADVAHETVRSRMAHLLDALDEASAHYTERARKQRGVEMEASLLRAVPDSHAPLVYLVDDDTMYAERLATYALAAGYRVRVLEDIAALTSATGECLPDVIVMDMVLADGALAGAKATAVYAYELSIPVVFLSARSDVEARLAAVRAGAANYFVKPVDAVRIIAALDQLTAKRAGTPYRILLIDDDVELCALYARQLNNAGMQVTLCHVSSDAIATLASTQPELIVLDVDMPDINGLELAALIRQMDEFNHVPIVFLSSDSSIQTRLASMRLCADDYWCNPMAASTLVEILRVRVARARTVRDGHVGLRRALRDLEFMQKAVDEHAIVATTDAEGRIVHVNRKFTEISGYTQEELVGQTHRIVKSGRHPEAMYDQMWETIASGRAWHGTLTNRAKDGHLYQVSTTIVPKLDDAGMPVQYMSIRTDVTHLKSLRHSLAQQAERLSLALEATDSKVWEWTISSNEVIDDNTAWANAIHPDDFERTYATLMQHVEGGTPAYISEHRVSDGHNGWNWVREMGKVVEYDRAGAPTRLVGTTQIINERVALQQQERRLQQKLVQAAKMEAIGHLTAGIAHDFNNLLGSMLGYTELSADCLDHPHSVEKVKDYLAYITAAGIRAKELIAQMLAFSRVGPGARQDEAPVALLQPVVKEVVQLLRSSIPSTIELNCRIDDPEARVRLMPVQLHQILLNLVINARDALGKYGRIDVGLARYVAFGSCSSCHHAFKGDYVALTVKDTGSGIAGSLLCNIFEPFFTTKEVGSGSGMGLSVVHGIVHAAGGHITVDSTTKHGTSVRVLLPAAIVAAASPHDQRARADETQVDDALSGLRIMVVDDEHAMSSMLYELLSMHGAQVTAFNHPGDAVAAFTRNPLDVDLVITDETMPERSGLDMARFMRAMKPDLPVILCTGYSDHVNPEIAKQHGIAQFMYKPLDIGKLLKATREVARVSSCREIE